VPIKRVPKAASKLLVAELKEELAGYRVSTSGTRIQLYERVQKARREARARGSEMWVPVGYEGEEPEDKQVKCLFALSGFSFVPFVFGYSYVLVFIPGQVFSLLLSVEFSSLGQMVPKRGKEPEPKMALKGEGSQRRSW
jgi:hypothetical protein